MIDGASIGRCVLSRAGQKTKNSQKGGPASKQPAARWPPVHRRARARRLPAPAKHSNARPLFLYLISHRPNFDLVILNTRVDPRDRSERGGAVWKEYDVIDARNSHGMNNGPVCYTNDIIRSANVDIHGPVIADELPDANSGHRYLLNLRSWRKASKHQTEKKEDKEKRFHER